MYKAGKALTVLNIGDVHLFHAQTPTEHILKNLERELLNDKLLSTLDLLFIAGDLFDTQVPYHDKRINAVESFITKLLYKCCEHNVVIRVVEGTPLHEWKQSQCIIRIAEAAKLPVDVRYFDTLAIEHIDSLDIDVLYVPDKWNPTSTEKTLEEVRELMRERGLSSVDFALMHGAFEFQLPEISKEPTHDSVIYQELVKFLIFIGHVHVKMVRDRIVPSGSFDRLTHGEEGPKGYHVAKVNMERKTFELKFHENKHAKIYHTMEVDSGDVDAVWEKAKEATEKYPKGSSFRIRCKGSDAFAKAVRSLQVEYPDHQWKIDTEKTKKEKSESMAKALGEGMIELPDLTPDVIREHVKSYFEQKGLDETTWLRLEAKLMESMNGLH